MSGQPTRLITLTSRRRADKTADRCAQELVAAWRLIRRRWRSNHPRDRIEFLAIFEQTQTGWPHLHILMHGPFLPQRWLSSQMKELTDSPIVDIRAVRHRRGAAKYVSKYCAKGPGKFGTLKRYWTSQKYEGARWERPRYEVAWERQTFSLRRWMDAWRSEGWSVELIDGYSAIARPP